MNAKKKTKIVATIGPASESEKIFSKMAEVGLDVARLNFSHGSHDEHGKRIKLVRKVSKKIGRPIAILQDLAGPKIRIGEFADGKIFLKKGQKFTLTTKEILGDETRVSVSYKDLPKNVQKGDLIMLEDGSKKLQVLGVSGDNVKCQVLVGGELKSKKGVNLPGVSLNISSLTPKDKKDLKFGLENKVDFVGLSFVRSPKDVLELKKIIDKNNSAARVVAKIETKEALKNIDEIIKATDCVMVARGDLGIEIPFEEVPLIQKMIIKKCNKAGKPVITATQMFESMIKNPTPTRAEAADVANAILDGTDAVMLSEETTLGSYPAEAVETMAIVAKKAENMIDHKSILDSAHSDLENPEEVSTVDAVSYAVCRIAYRLNAKIIVTFTKSGFTSRMISRWRPKQAVLSLTTNVGAHNCSALQFGVVPKLTSKIKTHNSMRELARKMAIESGLVKKGDKIVISGGVPFGKSGTTNLLLIQTI